MQRFYIADHGIGVVGSLAVLLNKHYRLARDGLRMPDDNGHDEGHHGIGTTKRACTRVKEKRDANTNILAYYSLNIVKRIY